MIGDTATRIPSKINLSSSSLQTAICINRFLIFHSHGLEKRLKKNIYIKYILSYSHVGDTVYRIQRFFFSLNVILMLIFTYIFHVTPQYLFVIILKHACTQCALYEFNIGCTLWNFIHEKKKFLRGIFFFFRKKECTILCSRRWPPVQN